GAPNGAPLPPQGFGGPDQGGPDQGGPEQGGPEQGAERPHGPPPILCVAAPPGKAGPPHEGGFRTGPDANEPSSAPPGELGDREAPDFANIGGPDGKPPVI